MNLAHDLQQKLSGEVTAEDLDLQDASQDFGRIRLKRPALAVRPSSTEDVVQAVRFASGHGLTLTVRGAAHSQSGQCLNESGLVLDIKSLNRMVELNPEEE